MREQATELPNNLKWSELLDEALTIPGNIGNTYNRFYNYSFANQLLLMMQGVREPVNTYKRWGAMGRQVLKGSKAKGILVPIKVTVENEQGEPEQRVRGFKLVNCLFGVSETDGEPLPEVESKTWDRNKALAKLAIKQVPFTMLNGNVAGYSINNEFALNPVAPYPLKTMVHELGHIVLGHTTRERQNDYAMHRGVMEFQAESVAYLTMNELELSAEMNAGESRAYIQTWLQGETPEDRAIKQVFAATDKILRAGRE